MQFHPGQAVRIRGERWRIVAESCHGAASVVSVDGRDTFNRGVRARFVVPPEALEPVSSPPPPRLVSVTRWRRAARSSLSEAVPHWASLRAAAWTRLRIIPFQLEPALALTSGDGCRVLIADDVGLGKTIQAGLIVAEAVARVPDARVLVVAPAGLRDQWRNELRQRFGLEPEVLDAAGIARAGAHLGPHVNPWSVFPVSITSIDYVKRPDVMRSLEALLWDVIVFDEAHALTGQSDRGDAAAGLAARARSVVLLTATPHSGDEQTYTRLCNLGDLPGGFPLMTFRRTRADVGLPHDRRTVRLRVHPTAAEAAMHAALASYNRLLLSHADAAGHTPAASLVASVLTRRACSSAGSLARSLERRAALLAQGATPLGDQLTLPFAGTDGDEEPGIELGTACMPDADEEQRWLQHLIAVARDATAVESKVDSLRRFLKRANQPALVFTEYRDTLACLAGALVEFNPACLHGGMTGSERRRALRQFDEPHATLLLATDAASEGLNLQRRCRLVVNLDLPWTPTRLEQRIGRVDRIGQRRRVHAVQLVSTGTQEEAASAQLAARGSRAREALAATRDATDGSRSRLSSLADDEAERLLGTRQMIDQPRIAPDRPVFTIIRTGADMSRSTWAFRLPIVDAGDHVVFETIVGVRAPTAMPHRALEWAAAAAHRRLLAAVQPAVDAWRQTMLRREDAIVEALRMRHARLAATLLQPRLFDGRVQRAAEAQAATTEAAMRHSRARREALDRLTRLREETRTVVFGICFRR